MMTDLEAIDLRRSRRSYTGPLPEAAAEAVEALSKELAGQTGLTILLAKDAPAVFGGFSKSYGMFKGVRSFIVLAGNNQDGERFEKAGHAGEWLTLELTKMGLGSCWLTGTFNKEAVARLLGPQEVLVGVITAGPVPAGLTTRERLVHGVTHLGNTPFPNNATAGAPPWFAAGAQAAAKAPSAGNKRPARFAWKNGVATASVPGENDTQFVDLGIAKLHFELAAGGRFSLGNNAVFAKDGEEPR